MNGFFIPYHLHYLFVIEKPRKLRLRVSIRFIRRLFHDHVVGTQLKIRSTVMYVWNLGSGTGRKANNITSA
jgi:hypothetical protein